MINAFILSRYNMEEGVGWKLILVIHYIVWWYSCNDVTVPFYFQVWKSEGAAG